MAELRASGLDLIREYIPDSPEYHPEDVTDDQYNIPYVPQTQPPEVPDYQPSAIINVPELEEEEEVHVKFTDPPASPPPTGDVLMEITPGTPSLPGQLHASVHPTFDAKIILHSENSGPPQRFCTFGAKLQDMTDRQNTVTPASVLPSGKWIDAASME